MRLVVTSNLKRRKNYVNNDDQQAQKWTDRYCFTDEYPPALLASRIKKVVGLEVFSESLAGLIIPRQVLSGYIKHVSPAG